MFHPGEKSIQSRAGVHADRWGSAGVGPVVPPVAEEFLAQQQFVVISGDDVAGSPWATPLTGRPGFVDVPEPETVRIAAALPGVDPLSGAFDTERDIGMLAIEPSTRRRMRVNGRGRITADGFLVRTEQVYSNCPKYIQTRTVTAGSTRGGAVARSSARLSAGQEHWIATADTFFVGTRAPGLGSDVSHRGGNPGFVTVEAGRVSWPDYVGNSMYMTLGNLHLDPHAGLLFIDWQHGHTLHLTGRAEIDWDSRRAAAVPGAQRHVDFHVDRVVQIDNRNPQTWNLEKYSKFNPA